MNLSNTVLVTHQGCLDGSACAILFIAAGGKRENIFFTSPNNFEVDDIVEGLVSSHAGPILIVDVSLTFEVAKKIKRNDVYLLDHHKAAIPLKELSWCEIDIDNTRCGSKMLYDWLHSSMVHLSSGFRDYENLITYVDDQDRWTKEYKHSDIISIFHGILGQEFFIDRFLKNSGPALNSMEQYVVDLEIKKRSKYIENKKKKVEIVTKNIDGQNINIGFVYANQYQSSLGNEICNDPKLDVDIAVMVGQSISLRANSRCLVDLSKIARLNDPGGGGHRAASGFSINSILKDDLINLAKENIKWKQD